MTFETNAEIRRKYWNPKRTNKQNEELINAIISLEQIGESYGYTSSFEKGKNYEQGN